MSMKMRNVQICVSERIVYDGIDKVVMLHVSDEGQIVVNGRRHQAGVQNSNGYIISPSTAAWLGVLAE